MTKATIAIHPDKVKLKNGAHQSYSDRWILYAKNKGYDIKIVDVQSNDILRQLDNCQGLMWRFSISPAERAIYSRLLPILEKEMHLNIFPNWKTMWHYDDKITQNYLLKAHNIPIPKTWVFWKAQEADEFCASSNYPMVLKLAGGASSVNVQLIENYQQAKKWINLLYSSGLHSLKIPEPLRVKNFQSRIKNALRFLFKGKLPNPGKYWQLNKNYFLLQEFLPNNQYDIRITVIGKRAFGYRRFNRQNDFRASGSGSFDVNPKEIDIDAVQLGFITANRLQMQSVAVDIIHNGNEYVVNEVSYTFVDWMVYECPGYWVMKGDECSQDEIIWNAERLHPADAIIEDFLGQLDN